MTRVTARKTIAAVEAENNSNNFLIWNLQEQKRMPKTVTASGNFLAVNIGLVFLAVVLAVTYAFWVNAIVSFKYKSDLLKIKLSNLTENNNALLSEKSDAVNLGSLIVFSKQAGLVEQKNIEYVFDQNNVAQIPDNSLR